MKVKIGDLVTFVLEKYPFEQTVVGLVVDINTLNYGPNHDRDPFYDSTFCVHYPDGSRWIGPREIRGVVNNDVV